MEKLNKLLDILECENRDDITAETELSSIEEWDSMGKISVITMLSADYHYNLTFSELKELSKISDILKLMN